MIISSMNFKGGAGKTMVCTNLAVAFAQQGKKVCIVDTDESFAATKWAGRREEQHTKPSIPVAQMVEAKTIVSLVRQLDRDNDVVIIDAPPRLNPLVSKIILLSDLVIIPVPPKSGNDREVTEDFLQRFEAIQEQRIDNGRTPAYLLINMLKEGYNLHSTFVASLPQLCEDYGVKMFETRINDLVAFGEVNQFGLGITEYSAEKAKKIFNAFFQEVQQYTKQ
jgi:chromosome partitioning protein